MMTATDSGNDVITWRSVPPVRYPDQYLWILFFSAMDVILTDLVLGFGGEEVNPVANLVIQHWGMIGALLFKLGLVTFVIVMCEVIGRARDRTGRMLARVSVVISAIPVVWSLSLLLAHREAIAQQAHQAVLGVMF